MDEGQEVELVMDQEELDLPPSLANSDHHSDSAEDGVSGGQQALLVQGCREV